MTTQESVLPASDAATLLFIDDEANILAALKRLFNPLGYRILTAESGVEALMLLEKERVDLVISDMRMPQMSGAEVLEQIRIKWPDIVRLLLTGYSDVNSTIAAVNRGEIYRYIAKPWDDNDIVLMVRDALERKHLLDEKLRLEARVLRQNEELIQLNASLEDRVRQRTEDLNIVLELLKDDYFTTVQVFANLMELRKGAMAGHSRRVAQLCRDLAHKMLLSQADTNNLVTAALLHNIGKIGLPNHLLETPYMELSSAERAEFDKHPRYAAATLMALNPLKMTAKLIRYHREHYDGVDNASGLRGEGLPLGSRILLVASDFDALQQGLITHGKLSPDQAIDRIVSGRNTIYDPIVVDVFRQLMPQIGGDVGAEFLVTSAQLHEGMRLTRDVVTANGMLLLFKDTVLNAECILDIREIEQSEGVQLPLYTDVI
ncbi:MAG TPA: HD domain-containing phosphohydrolase [Gallionella sp.]|nr:HD domain-containing phosphohydrolase [Gallionella sp.]